MIRPAAVAGFFYPADAAELTAMVQGYLQRTPVPLVEEGRWKAMVAPHAGFVYSGIVAAACYKQLQRLSQQTHWKVFLLGPTHRVPVNGVSVGAYEAYDTPLGRVPVSPIAQDLAAQLGFVPATHQQEHALEVQLPFLQLCLSSFEIIPILMCNMPPAQLIPYIKPYLDDQTLLIASSDLSHYYPYPVACSLDSICNEAIPKLDIPTMARKGEACGKLPVLTVMQLAKENNWQGVFLDYKNSGDTSPDKTRVVGYGAYGFLE